MDTLSHITVSEAKEMFLRSLGLLQSTNTFQTYRKALDTFTSVLSSQQINPSDFVVANLSEETVIDFVAYTEKFSSATESLYLQVLKGFFEYLSAEKLTTVNPSRVRMLIRQRTRRAERKISLYPENDIRYFIDAVSNAHAFDRLAIDDKSENFELRHMRDRAIIIVLADTGLRTQEVCKLRCGEVNWESKCAILKGRGNKKDVVRLSARSIDASKEYLRLRQVLDLESGQPLPSLPLFARHDKGAGKKIKPITPTTIRRIIAERVRQILGDEATGNITPNTFLHYFVTTVMLSTGNLKLAQELARHKNIQVTQRYAHLNDDELDRGYYEVFEKKEK